MDSQDLWKDECEIIGRSQNEEQPGTLQGQYCVFEDVPLNRGQTSTFLGHVWCVDCIR